MNSLNCDLSKATWCLALILMMMGQSAFSRISNCDYVVQPSTGLKVYRATDFPGIGAGSTLCLMAGEYGTLRFLNLEGSEAKPITIRNHAGRVILDGRDVNYGVLQFNNSKFIHLTGSGQVDVKYGIFIRQSRLNDNNKSGLSGVVLGSLSSDFEIDHLEIQKVGFAGIIAKTDPTTDNVNTEINECDLPESQATFRANFTLRNLHIHDNFIHNTGGEGMYIGSTWGFTTTTDKDTCNGFAHLLENVKINNNRIEQTGWDAIQVSLAHKNTQIHDNEIHGYGHYAALEGEKNQSFGIALGGGTKALVYNNKIIQRVENMIDNQRAISGIDILTGSKFYNNLIVGSGEHGIWVHLRYVENEILPDLKEELGIHFLNNTIVASGVSRVTPGLKVGQGLGVYVSTCQPRKAGDAGCRYNFDLRFINNIVVDPSFNLDAAPSWMRLEDTYIQMVTKELRNSPNSIRSNNLYVRSNPTDEDIGLGTKRVSELKFVRAASNDYRLLAGSLAIDAGLDLSLLGVNDDLLHNPRPNGRVFDIGAFEYGVKTTVESDDSILDLLPAILASPKTRKPE